MASELFDLKYEFKIDYSVDTVEFNMLFTYFTYILYLFTCQFFQSRKLK